MDNDKKHVLMQYLYRFAEHYGIENARDISFKKRQLLLESLKINNEGAWQVIDSLFAAFIKASRIENDKEKFDRARVLWDAEHAAAEHEKVEAEITLVKFCRENKIAIGGIEAEA